MLLLLRISHLKSKFEENFVIWFLCVISKTFGHSGTTINLHVLICDESYRSLISIYRISQIYYDTQNVMLRIKKKKLMISKVLHDKNDPNNLNGRNIIFCIMSVLKISIIRFHTSALKIKLISSITRNIPKLFWWFWDDFNDRIGIPYVEIWWFYLP